MERFAWLGLPILVLGCAIAQPGHGVSAEFAGRYGCSAELIAKRAEVYHQRLQRGRQFIPQVGWDACELMARNGAPDDVDRIQSAYGQSHNWWWHSDAGAHLVTLERHSGEPKWVGDCPDGECRIISPWVVTYVGW